MTTKLFTTLTLSLTLLLSSLNSSAQNVASEPEPLFEIKVNNDIWPINSELDPYVLSLVPIHGIYWETRSFTHESSKSFLSTGNSSVPLNATLRSKSKVPEQISKVIISLSSNKVVPKGTLQSIDLYITDGYDEPSPVLSKDLSNVEFIPSNVEFEIENPQSDKLYSLVFNVNPRANGWLELNSVKFFDAVNGDNLSTPIITISNLMGVNQYTVSVPEGELHLLASDFSYEDEQYVFKGNVYPSTSGDIAHTETEEENWRSTVPSSNSKQLSLSANVDSSVFTKIRAKAVSGSSQSPELVTWIHQTGIATSIEGIKVTETEDNNTTWYNLQGQPTANPASGLYIRVRNGKAEKVML